jgi:FG-GAP-like repeat
VADIDGDGHLDVVGTNYQSGSAKVLYGDGTGAFDDAHPVGNGGESTSYMVAATADLDASGTPDVILGGVPTGLDTNVSVLLNTLGKRHHER